MRQFPHLKRNHRSGNWVYFRRFPTNLRAVCGRAFFERSLRTSDRKRIADAWVVADREFQKIISEVGGQERPRTQGGAVSDECLTPLNVGLPRIPRWSGDLADTQQVISVRIDQIREAIIRWSQQEKFDRAQRLLNRPPLCDDDTDFVDECKSVGACGHHRSWLFYNPRLHSLTVSILEKADIKIDPWHGAVYIAQRLVEDELKNIIEAEYKWRRFDFADLPTEPPFSKNQSNIAPNKKPYLPLSQVIDQYCSARQKPLKTRSKLNLVCRYIEDITEKNVAVQLVTKDVLIDLQALAIKIPARQTGPEKKLGLRDLASRVSASHESRPCLTVQAVRSWFNLLGGCFNWAVAADLIERNPTNGIKPKPNAMSEIQRESFTIEDLTKIFSNTTYPKVNEGARYWIPLIGLYTGARLNEIGQLLQCDVVLTPVPHIAIDDRVLQGDARKRLKNIASRRKIPLHPRLIEYGFLEYVSKCNTTHLFPELPHQGLYEPTKAFSQWFGRYLRSIGIQSKTKVFHSFRHSFKDGCRRAGIDEELHDALTGHTNSRHVGRAYGSGVPLMILADAVANIDYGLC